MHQAEHQQGSSLLAAALTYAARGWRVFPCHTVHDGRCSCGQADCKDQGKHPRTPHGLHDATTDATTIRAWWTRWPDANIAIRTGGESGLVVVDMDKKPHADGEDSLRDLEQRYGPLPETAMQITGGGGSQRLFTHPGGKVANNHGGLAPAVDIKGDGGYAIVPPSRHLSGRTYEWELSHHPDETPLAGLPAAWVTLLQAQSNGARAHSDTDGEVIHEGQRNDVLFRLACSLRAKGLSQGAIAAALQVENAARCQPPLPEGEVGDIAKSASRYEPGGRNAAAGDGEQSPWGRAEKENPWGRIKDAKVFAQEERKSIEGIAKDVLFPGIITMITGPKGIGKSLIGVALGVASTVREGTFRGDRVRPARLLYLDRENPEGISQKRLLSWDVLETENFHILTREQDPPVLTNRKAWADFPVEQYDVVIFDSVGSFSEGVTEKEGKDTTLILATLRDLAARGVGLLLLNNTEKTGTDVRGRGEWADRVDVHYEVRDMTGVSPTGRRHWSEEVPADGAADWRAREARRRGKHVFRVAFFSEKFRIGPQPDPFVLEMALPPDASWTLTDVTTELDTAEAAARAQAEQSREDALAKAAAALVEVVKDRAATGEPLLKEEAAAFLCREQNLPQKAARTLISDQDGRRWHIKKLEGKKGRPQALLPLSQTDEQRKSDPPGNPHGMGPSEARISVAPDKSGNGNGPSSEPVSNEGYEDTLFPSPGKSRATEIGSQKSLSNGACRDTPISVAEEIETEDLNAADTHDAGGFDWASGEQATAEEGEI
jgi:hypothetical protein